MIKWFQEYDTVAASTGSTSHSLHNDVDKLKLLLPGVIFKLVFADEYVYNASLTNVPLKNSLIKQTEGLLFMKYLLTHEVPVSLHQVVIHSIYIILITNPLNIVALEQQGLVEAIVYHFTTLCSDIVSIYVENPLVLKLAVDILQTIQLIAVISSEKDSNILGLLSSITMSLAATVTGNLLAYVIPPGINFFFELGNVYPDSVLTPERKCYNCETELARYECLDPSCLRDTCVLCGLCDECDKVFHKASSKRCHVRLPVVTRSNLQVLTPSRTHALTHSLTHCIRSYYNRIYLP